MLLEEERALIRDLQLCSLRLLNSLPSYDYSNAEREEQRQIVQKFCDMLLRSADVLAHRPPRVVTA